MDKTNLYINIDGQGKVIDSLLGGVVQGVEDFGRDVLSREFEVVNLPRCNLDLRNFVTPTDFIKTNQEIDIDSYHAAIQGFYEKNPNVPVFLLGVTNKPLVSKPESGLIRPYASSWANYDLSGELQKFPRDYNHHSIIVSPYNFRESTDENEIAARGYVLALHEMGHLVFGSDSCGKGKCITAHPENKKAALEDKVRILLSGGTLEYCGACKNRLEEFKRG